MSNENNNTIVQESKFFQISQNNSNGRFVCDDKLCAELFIEADSAEEATNFAESLGCYWNGCDKGMDSYWSGDRWIRPRKPIQFQGFGVVDWYENKINHTLAIKRFKSTYPNATWLVEPIAINEFSLTKVHGKIKVDSIELYAQVYVNETNFTSPGARIFYKNGDIKEIRFNKAKAAEKETNGKQM